MAEENKKVIELFQGRTDKWERKAKDVKDALIYHILDDIKRADFRLLELSAHFDRLGIHCHDKTMQTLKMQLPALKRTIFILCGESPRNEVAVNLLDTKT